MQALTKNKVLLFIIGFLLLANIGILLSFAWKKDYSRKEVRAERPDLSMGYFLKNEIGFSEQQIAAYEKEKQDYRIARKPLFEELSAAKSNFFKLLSDSTVKEATLDSASTVIGEKQKAIDMHAFSHFKRMREMCTADQLPKFDARIQERIRIMINAFKKGGWHKEDSLKPKK